MESIRPSPALYDEILERILDRGIVLDGLSSLAAASSKIGRSLHATVYCPVENEPEPAACVLFPPRVRDRE